MTRNAQRATCRHAHVRITAEGEHAKKGRCLDCQAIVWSVVGEHPVVVVGHVLRNGEVEPITVEVCHPGAETAAVEWATQQAHKDFGDAFTPVARP